MMTSEADRQDTASNDAANEDSTALTERRRRLQTAQKAAARVEQQLDDLNEQLEANAQRQSANEAALQAALDRQVEMKRALKSAATEREKLRDARKRVTRAAEEARRRTEVADAKYDKALLDDVLRKEKAADLSTHDAKPKSRRSKSAKKSTVADSTAQKTAAAVTARKAKA